jgi:multidrug efflux system outer membrane protein
LTTEIDSKKLMPRYTFNLKSASRLTPQTLSCALALAFSLGGCASQPAEPSRFSDSPDIALTSNPDIANPLAQWWQRFNDPQLTQLVTQALQANTSLRSAQAALLQARAQVDVQSAGLLPSVGTSASAQRSRASNNTGNSFQAGLDASWEPDVFGGKRSALGAAEADAQAAVASLADVQVSVAAEVALAYIQLRGQQTQLAIAASNLASQQETLQITEWRAAGRAYHLAGSRAGPNFHRADKRPDSCAGSQYCPDPTQSGGAHRAAPDALQALMGARAAGAAGGEDLALAFPRKRCASARRACRRAPHQPLRWRGFRRRMPRVTPVFQSAALWA